MAPGPQVPVNVPNAGSAIIKRKRITQRIAVGEVAKLAGLQTKSSGLSIPSSPLPTVTMEIPTPKVQGTCEIPLAVILRALPAEVLTADAESLAASEAAQQGVALPLDNVLSMLPSGKVEFSLRDFSKWIPQGYLHPVESLGAAADTFVRLPLHDVVSRIPAEFLTIRADQKTIDTSVKTMADPFSEEMIRQLAAKNEAAALAAQAEAAKPPVEESAPEAPAEEAQAEEPVAPPAPEPASFDLPDEPAAAALEPEPVAAAEAPASEAAAPAFDISKFDFSTMQDLPAEEQAPPAPAAESGDFEVPALEGSGDPTEAGDLGIALKEEAPPPAPVAETGDEDKEESSKLAPEVTTQDLSALFSSALSNIKKPEPEAEAAAEIAAETAVPEPEEMPAPEAEAEAPEPVAMEPAPAPPAFVPPPPPFAKPAAFVPPASPAVQPPAFVPPLPPVKPAAVIPPPPALTPPPPPVIPAPAPVAEIEEAPEPAPVEEIAEAEETPVPPPVPPLRAHEPAPALQIPIAVPSKAKAAAGGRISPLVNEMLGFDHNDDLKIQDIVRQISKWPDIHGCLLASNEGLSICDTLEERALSRKLAAFAPKVLNQCGDLTRELVGNTCRELHLPLDGDISISIFGRESLNMVLTHGDKRLPLAYCEIIRKVLELLAKFYHKD
jgi:predicted regulator of Ras-like GTPase activity (Roadblock/LC7/MglB family)